MKLMVLYLMIEVAASVVTNRQAHSIVTLAVGACVQTVNRSEHMILFIIIIILHHSVEKCLVKVFVTFVTLQLVRLPIIFLKQEMKQQICE